jgi:hypothetical protein
MVTASFQWPRRLNGAILLAGPRECGMSDHTSIFEEKWWYQAATGGKWQQVEYNDGRGMSATLVFATYSNRGSTIIGMPTMARVMQPVIRFESNKPKGYVSDCVRALKGLADLLPKSDQFKYTLPPESNLDIAYALAGYSVTANYTFRTDPGGQHDPWAAMDQKVRYNIKTGLKRMGVERHDDVDRYITLSRRFIKERAFNNITDYDAIGRIWEVCHARRQGSIISCVNAEGQDVASAILLWDDRHLYYWLNCRNPELQDYSANSVLIWKAVEIAQQAGLVFDMDGYATPDAGLFLSRFGLLPHRRFDVSMTKSAARVKAAISSHVVEMVGPNLRKTLLTARNAIDFRKAGWFRGTMTPTARVPS